jgi:putative 4-mercaptohistidine N1-methyltranferase
MLVRHLPINMLVEKNNWSLLCDSENNILNITKNQIINIESGDVKLGRLVINTSTYGWDNEFGEDLFKIDAFSTSKYLVSNVEFLEFVEDNGYQQKQYWTPDGWNYKSFNNVNNPRFWRKDLNTGNWYLRTLLKEIDMPWDWPAEVNYLEAKAFCNWKQSKISSDVNKIYCRLLTEPEHTLLRNRFVTDDTAANHGLVQQSPCSVFRYNQGELNDIVGNVWQWTESFIYPFNGFEVHPAYDDFTIPCFDNKHNLIKGSSWVSCGNEIDINSRYAFRQHFYQYAGFRYVITNNSEYDIKYNSNNNPYETDDMVCQYIEFHYGSIYFNIPNYLKRSVEECINFLGNSIRFQNAIDIGCSVGRFTFELAKYCDKILGIDLSARFIQVCYNIRDNVNLIPYVIPIEGDIKEYKQINPVEIRNDLSISLDDCSKINFLQKDACNLPLSEYNNYDFIFCGNLIDRLSDPKIFLETLHKRMVIGGILVMTSPYTWTETYTTKENWIGGKKISGEDQTTLQTLEILLSPHFELLKVKDIEFVIRETKRKFQHTISEMSIWRRK